MLWVRRDIEADYTEKRCIVIRCYKRDSFNTDSTVTIRSWWVTYEKVRSKFIMCTHTLNTFGVQILMIDLDITTVTSTEVALPSD